MSEKFVVKGGLSIPQGSNLEIGGVNLSSITTSSTLSGNSSTAIPSEFSVKQYVDSKVGNSSLTFTSDGAESNLLIDLDSETLKIAGGSNLTTSASGNEITVALDDTISVASLTATTADINGGTIDGVTIATSDVTVGAGKTLDVSAGTLTLSAGQIGRADLEADIIDGSKLADDSVDSEHLVADSIDTEHYAPGSVDTAALGTDSVTGAKIADDTIDSEHYAAGSIDNEHIADSTIANGKLVNDSLTVTAGSGLSGGGAVALGSSVSLALDLAEATAAEIDNSADSFLFVDASDSNSTKQESIADLVAGMDGTGLTATNGSLSVDTSQTQVVAVGALDTGSITSGFGNINIGSSTITTTGAADLGSTTVDSLDASNGGITNAGSVAGATSIDGSGDLTMGTITMTGFTVDADGDTTVKSLSLGTGNVTGSSDDMSLQSGTVTDYTHSASAGNMSVQAEAELVLESAVRLSSDFAVTADGSAQNMFTFAGANFHSAKVNVRIGDGTDVTAKELLVVCDEAGANPAFVEYGTVSSGSELTNTWTVSASGGTVTVKCQGANGNTIKGSYELLKA